MNQSDASRRKVLLISLAVTLFFLYLPQQQRQKYKEETKQQHRSPIRDGLTLISLVTPSFPPLSPSSTSSSSSSSSLLYIPLWICKKQVVEGLTAVAAASGGSAGSQRSSFFVSAAAASPPLLLPSRTAEAAASSIENTKPLNQEAAAFSIKRCQPDNSTFQPTYNTPAAAAAANERTLSKLDSAAAAVQQQGELRHIQMSQGEAGKPQHRLTLLPLQQQTQQLQLPSQQQPQHEERSSGHIEEEEGDEEEEENDFSEDRNFSRDTPLLVGAATVRSSSSSYDVFFPAAILQSAAAARGGGGTIISDKRLAQFAALEHSKAGGAVDPKRRKHNIKRGISLSSRGGDEHSNIKQRHSSSSSTQQHNGSSTQQHSSSKSDSNLLKRGLSGSGKPMNSSTEYYRSTATESSSRRRSNTKRREGVSSPQQWHQQRDNSSSSTAGSSRVFSSSDNSQTLTKERAINSRTDDQAADTSRAAGCRSRCSSSTRREHPQQPQSSEGHRRGQRESDFNRTRSRTNATAAPEFSGSSSSSHGNKHVHDSTSSSNDRTSNQRRRRRSSKEGATYTNKRSNDGHPRAGENRRHSTLLSSSSIEGENSRSSRVPLRNSNSSSTPVESVNSSEAAFSRQQQYLLLNSDSSSRDHDGANISIGDAGAAAAAASGHVKEARIEMINRLTSEKAVPHVTAHLNNKTSYDTHAAATASPDDNAYSPTPTNPRGGSNSSSRDNAAGDISSVHIVPSSSVPDSSSSPAAPSSSSSLPSSSSSIAHVTSSADRVSSSSGSASRSGSEGSRAAAAAVWWEEWRWLWLIFMSFSLVIVAGIASGLTTGLMAFDEVQLLVVQQAGASPQKQQAAAVCDLMGRNRHQLLVTLLLCNALAMEALPLFLDRLVSPVLAVLLSVTAILFVGEILPQALCTGRYQLAIAASLAPFVRLLLILLWPAAYPISRLLDCWLSERNKPSLYGREHLKALIACKVALLLSAAEGATGLHQRDRLQPLLVQHRRECQRASRVHTPHRSSVKAARKAADHQQFAAVSSGTSDGGGGGHVTGSNGSGAAAAGDAAAAVGAAAGGGAAAATGAAAGAATGAAAAATGAEAEGVVLCAARAAGGSECGESAAGLLRETGRQQMKGESPAGSDAAAAGARWGEAAGSGEQGSLAAANRPAEKNVLLRSEEDVQHAVGLYRDEVLIMQGALDMACKSVCELMVPLEDVFMLEASVRLTRPVLIDILAKGHSRIPVYENRRENIRGVLLMKSLVLIDPKAGVRLADLMRGRTFRRLCTPLFVGPTINPYQLLNEFQEGRCHLAFVTWDVAAYQQAWERNISVPVGARLLGIVTLEDVIEELIQEEIMDEFDRRFKAESSSSVPSVDRQSSTSVCLRAMKHSSSYASGQTTHPGELYSMLQPPREQPPQEVRQPADVTQTRDIERYSSEADTLRSSRTLSRFASLLLTGNRETALVRGDLCDIVDQGRPATSILASSQLGSRASLLFASAPDIEFGRGLDIVVWKDPHDPSLPVNHVGRRPQQHERHDRRRRKTAYFPISKNFAATYRPAAHFKTFTTKSSMLVGSSKEMPSHLVETILSTSPLSSAASRLQLVPRRVSTAAAGVDTALSPGRSHSDTYVTDAQYLPLTGLPSRAVRPAEERSQSGSDCLIH